tara:strand:- start:3910 stop:4107 length:198 start_codon:yes stop_codon:yes gene_type:complete
MVIDKVIHFSGTLALEGDLSKINMKDLKDYLTEAVSIDINTEDHGHFSDDLEVTGIGLDWESLEE